jgi:drug/metabolite transporter (DMT)-like permease
VGVATIYAYINPLIAVLAGAVWLHEPLNIYIGLAFVTIVVSVFTVNLGYRQQRKTELKNETKPLVEVVE